MALNNHVRAISSPSNLTRWIYPQYLRYIEKGRICCPLLYSVYFDCICTCRKPLYSVIDLYQSPMSNSHVNAHTITKSIWAIHLDSCLHRQDASGSWDKHLSKRLFCDIHDIKLSTPNVFTTDL